MIERKFDGVEFERGDQMVWEEHLNADYRYIRHTTFLYTFFFWCSRLSLVFSYPFLKPAGWRVIPWVGDRDGYTYTHIDSSKARIALDPDTSRMPDTIHEIGAFGG